MYHFLSGFTSKPAGTYAAMLGDRIDQHNAEVYLVNTGWTGGPYGVGKRMDLKVTRAMVGAATQGLLRGVPDDVLDPQSTWEDKDAYEIKARELAGMFADNFERFRESVLPEVAKAGPSAD